MTRTPVHQWLAGASTGDAITAYAQALQAMLRRWGHSSEIYTDFRHISFDMRRHCRDLRSFPEGLPAGSAVIYHFSVGSGMTECFLALPPGVARVVCYHNITPARYFHALRPETARVLEEGRRQLARLAPQLDLGLGVSKYNCREMEDAGCTKTAVVPLLWNRPDLSQPPDPQVLEAYQGRATNWIFVGRVVPNKKIEDIIRAFFHYQKFVHSHSRLFIVGSCTGMSRYFSALRALAAQLDLSGVVFTDHVTPSQLAAYYRLAHVLVCMSEHEGFCLPLLEAMSFDVPVLAYAASAIPETMGDGGILFFQKDFPQVAELAYLAATDPQTRETLIRAGRRRLEDFRTEAVERSLHDALSGVSGFDIGYMPGNEKS